MRNACVAAAALVIAGAEVAGEVLFLRRPLPPFRTLLALLGYSGARLAQVAWEAAVASPARLEALLGGAEAAAKVAAAAEAQAGMRHADLALYSSLLGSLMALCLGFIGMEGNELVRPPSLGPRPLPSHPNTWPTIGSGGFAMAVPG